MCLASSDYSVNSNVSNDVKNAVAYDEFYLVKVSPQVVTFLLVTTHRN